jgi:hypothetical protein
MTSRRLVPGAVHITDTRSGHLIMTTTPRDPGHPTTSKYGPVSGKMPLQLLHPLIPRRQATLWPR